MTQKKDLEKKLAVSDINDLRSRGWSQNQIAEHFGVSRQYVSKVKHKYGARLTPREIALREFPFEVPGWFTQASPHRRLRDHAEYIATGGIGMSEDSLKRLGSFYRKLHDENVVVEFDPDIPPEPGVSSRGGWAFRKRRKSDGDLIIRVNKHTNLTDAGHMIWRFPPREP